MFQRLAILMLSMCILIGGAARVWAADLSQLPYAPDQLIVKFKSYVNPESKQKFLGEIHAQSLKSLGSIGADVIHVDKSRSISAWIQVLEYHPWVEYVEPNYQVQTTVAAAPALPLPNDMFFNYLWGLNNVAQFSGGKTEADIDAPEAWKLYKPTSPIVVAVIDTGVDYNHPDLASNIWVNPAEDINHDGKLTKEDINGKDEDNNGLIDDVVGWNFSKNANNPMDDNGHGTHVSGTIAGRLNNQVGVAGVAGQGYVKIMPLKFLSASGSGYVADAVNALDYATRMHAQIANNSWGGGGYSQAMLAAMQQFQASGGLFVAAAGNSSANNDRAPFYPASYNLSNELVVASISYNNLLSTFSNYGPSSVQLAAPGTYIASTWPNNQYALLSGTSMATPHVSGVAALLWSHKGSNTTAAQIKAILLGTVRKNVALSGYTATGGVVNANNALKSP
jgi:subtilisin family serine protease